MERLEGVIQGYDWGSLDAIPALIGAEPTGEPQAELWFGAHPRGPSTLTDRGGMPLNELIAADPVSQLGSDAGELPFLAKVLAADQPLSIQTHPNRAQAEQGFEREDAEGLPIDAFERSFRDRNPKPELICALTPFEVLCGFREPEDSAATIEGWGIGEMYPLVAILGSDEPPAVRLAGALEWLLERRADEAAQLVAEAAQVDELVTGLNRHHPGDIGVLVAPLLHHITLQPGEALYLEAGNLHSYLGGVAVELMVNSDNVVRGGLTNKHIDGPTLLALVDTMPGHPRVQRADRPMYRYDGGDPDFALTRLDHTQTTTDIDGPAIAITTQGEVVLEDSDERVVLAAGQAAWIPARTGPLHVDATEGQLHLATTGR